MEHFARSRSLYLGRLFACCVRLQDEALGRVVLGAQHYAGARQSPERHFPYLLRVAAYYGKQAMRREPASAPAVCALRAEAESLHKRIMAYGGYPTVMTDEEQASFDEGFSLQWRRPTPSPRRVRVRQARLRLAAAAVAPAGAILPSHRVRTGADIGNTGSPSETSAQPSAPVAALP